MHIERGGEGVEVRKVEKEGRRIEWGREGGRKGRREGGRRIKKESMNRREERKKRKLTFKLPNFRYHRYCYSYFVNKRQIQAAHTRYDQKCFDTAFFNWNQENQYQTKENWFGHCRTEATTNEKLQVGEETKYARFIYKQRSSTKVLCNQIIMMKRSEFNDFQYIKEIQTKPSIPDFGGYNTKQIQEASQTTKNKTKVVCKQLVNKTLSDPSPILTAMCDTDAVSHQTGHLFTCHQ